MMVTAQALSLLRRLRHALPEGRDLPEAVWRRRHAGFLLFLLSHAVGLATLSALTGHTALFSAGVGAWISMFVVLGVIPRWSRRVRATWVSLGLVTSSAWLVHLSGGYIEMHFHYFVMVTFLALYQEWTPFLFAVGYVVFQHGVGGYLFPHTVYNHPDAWVHPWKWAFIHAGFLASSCIGVLIAWRANESGRIQMENLLHSAEEGFLGVGSDGQVIFANRSMERLTGVPVAELLGQRLDDVFGDRFRPTGSPEGALFQNVVALPTEIHRGEAVLHRKDKDPLVLEYHTSPLRDRLEIAGILMTFNDITDRKRAEQDKLDLEQQLRQAQKMEAVGQLAGGVAHDFNNVLTVISGYGDLVLQDVQLHEPHRQSIQQMKDAAQRATALVRQLLAFSRKQSLAPRLLNLNEIIRGLEPMLRRLISESITLTTNLAPDLRLVKVDAGQFEHIVLNLALNARDAMSKGGHLTIETRNVDLDGAYVGRHTGAVPGPHVMLSVSDTGHGMTPEVKSRIFEPFFTTKGVGKGTGLGLAMVYGTVKQSGGSIWVYSEVDRGTTLKIYLPQVEGDAVQIGIPALKAPKGLRGTETILLVEDEEVVRTLARTILAQQGYNVLEAANPDEAVLFSQRYGGTIHLLLTDVIMPKASGQQLAERLLSNRPDLKVLYMSGYTDDVIVDDGLSDPTRAFLEKPYSAEDLASKVRLLLDSR